MIVTACRSAREMNDRMDRLRLVQIVGARPQFVKLAPVSREIAAPRLGGILEEIIVHTGQHYDPDLSDVFFQELKIPRPHANLDVRSGTHGAQTGRMLELIESYLLKVDPDVVVVYGDTNSTLAGALAAAKLQIPLAHVEAGLRSFNRSMPEEINRIVTDHLSDLLLAPTTTAMQNLSHEGLALKSRLVGDVMYDSVLYNAEVARRISPILETLGIAAGAYGLVTIHRAENTTAAALAELLTVLYRTAASTLPLIFPVHPRTRAAIRAELPDWTAPPELRLIAPVGLLDMLRLTESAAFVLTDSGGLQKEAYMLGRPCITLRGETEWLETLKGGANVLVGRDADAAITAAKTAIAAAGRNQNTIRAEASAEYGSGTAAARVIAEILALLAERTPLPAHVHAARVSSV
jgi:UDP-N-acetylglucosamine 2-epimerase